MVLGDPGARAGLASVARGALVGAVTLLVACGGGRAEPAVSPEASPSDSSAWQAAFDSVRTLVAVDRHAAADSLLARFAQRHAGTPEGAEATYWRALVALDPKNHDATPRDVIIAIDGYLAGGIDQPRYAEALVLRRLASTLERARAEPVPTLPVTTLQPDSLPRLRAAQDTIRQLRLELERTQAELERIRRRIRP